jgi:uncharacterized membrane protein
VATGLGASLLLVAIGAILDFAFTASPYQHGFNINKVGLILFIVGIVGATASLAFLTWARAGGFHRRRTVVDDGRGNVVRREDTYE